MSSYTQNLFLFFEESEYQPDVSSNIVRIAMNKFIVDEDARFEVIGVYHLKKRIKPLDAYREFSETDREEYHKKAIEKYKYDQDIIYKALNIADSITTDNVDTHFIIGSRFHADNYIKSGDDFIDYYHQNRTPLICHWIAQEIQGTFLQSLQCTIFDGERDGLITRKMSEELFSSNVVSLDFALPNRADNSKPKSSVYDDIEKLIQEIKNNKRPTKHQVCSYLHLSLTENELLQLKENETQFWEKFPFGAKDSSCLPTPSCRNPKHWGIRALNDQSQTKFINIRCKRFTMM